MKKFFVTLALTALVAGLLPTVLTITAQANGGIAQYDPVSEGVVSGYLCVDPAGESITGIPPGTTLNELNIRSLPGDLTTTGETIGTGTVLTSATATQALSAVVTGDLNGDGAVTISDLLMVKSCILGGELSRLATVAGDVNYDSEVSISDFLGIKSYLLGLSQIAPQQSNSQESLIILAPNGSQHWDVTAQSFSDDGSGIATVTPKGIITAGSREGTGFVYAHDAQGIVTARTVVTVLKSGLTVSLDRNTYTSAPGQSIRATATLNHPVSAKILWQTGDSAICTVAQDGTLTGHALGSTTVRASLPNGSYAEATVKVMPPITGLDFGTHLHKLKPGATRQLPLTVIPANTGEEIIWKSSNPSVVTVSDGGVVTAVKYGTATVTATGKYTGKVASCTVKVCNVIQVAITFDDGPSKYTAKLLDWLKENEVKATFFLVVNRVNSYKNTVKRIVNEGHELGYHSYAHKFQIYLSTDQIISDYRKSQTLIKNLTGQEFTVWRAPGGNISDRILKSIPLPHIMWTVDTRDWKTLKTDSVYRSIINNAGDGKIILLHDLYKTSVDGAIKAMEQMRNGDYEFLTVTELLSRSGTAPAPSKSYSKSPKQ